MSQFCMHEGVFNHANTKVELLNISLVVVVVVAVVVVVVVVVAVVVKVTTQSQTGLTAQYISATS